MGVLLADGDLALATDEVNVARETCHAAGFSPARDLDLGGKFPWKISE